MKKRVTLRDIAAKAGVHVTTVSGVLRNKANFSAATREKVMAVAAELGYRPDPMLKALAAYRSDQSGTQSGSVIAMMGLGPAASLESWGYKLILDGARKTADLRGFKLEFFDMSADGMSGKRMSQILYTRGIMGVIIPPGPREDMALDAGFDLDLFSVVEIEDFLRKPQSLHRVMTDHFRNVRAAMERCVGAGYRRFGMIADRRWAHRQHFVAYSSFAGGRFRFGLPDDIPVLMQEPDWNRKDILEWAREYRPEVIFCNHHEPADILLSDSKLSIPEKISIVHFNIIDEEEPYAGMRISLEQVGVQAVDLVVAMIQRGEKGIPEHNIEVNVPGVWHPGPTLRV